MMQIRKADRRTRKRAAIPLSLLALAFNLTACAPQQRQAASPVMPVAAIWQQPQPDPDPDPDPHSSTSAAAATELGWRTYFSDPQLVALVDTALAQNRDLRLALLRVQEARARYGIESAAAFPTVGAGAQGARSRVPGDLSPTGNAVTASQYEVSFGVNNWELDLWGRVRSLREAALRDYLATDAASRAARIALVAEVANAYLALREFDERMALAKESIAGREEALRIFRRRNEVGSASALEVTQVETLLVQARALGAQLEQARAAQMHALEQLVGTPLALAPQTDPRWRDEAVFAPLQVGLPASLLSARPDIAAAEQRLGAASANIAAARAAFFPQLVLTGSLGSASAELDGLFDGGSRAWAFAPSISVPIFDGGRRRASLDLAVVRSDMAVAEYERTIQIAFREVADALSARDALGRQVAIARQALDVQVRRARLAQLRYDSGAAAYIEVLDAQRDLLSAQQQLVQVRRALLSSHVTLYAALGGGAIDAGQNPAPLAFIHR